MNVFFLLIIFISDRVSYSRFGDLREYHHRLEIKSGISFFLINLRLVF